MTPPTDTGPLGLAEDPARERRRAASERRSIDRRVRDVIEGMSDAFLALGPDWRVTYANREAARLNGVVPRELVGRDHWATWPETVGTEVEAAYRRVMATREPAALEHWYPASDRYHDIRAYPIDEGGIAIFYRDVTGERKLAAERERQARALSTAYDQALHAELQVRLLVDRVRDYAVFLMDPDGIITHWGEGARRMKGWTAEEIVGHHLRDLYPPGGMAEDGSADDHLRRAAESGEYIGEGTRFRRGTTPFHAHVVLTALRRGGELVGFSKITYDKTVEKRREESLTAALTAAREASIAKSQFLANTSHEIRTPLNAVIGYAELLDMGLAGPLGDGQRQYVGRIRETGRHLLSLINDVLDLSRIEAGHLHTSREAAPVREVVESAIAVVEPQARARRVTLVNGCLASTAAYQGDSERVRQVLVNLLSNAVRFTDAGGRVTVACGHADEAPREAVTAEDGPWTWIAVQDTGIGILPDQVQRIWDAFVQVDAAHTRKVGGSGLGLTISRHLSRLMGGDITLRSATGLGSTFTLWLPTAPTSPLPEPSLPDDTGGDANTIAQQQMQAHHVGLGAIGVGLLSESGRILAMLAARLRADERTPSAHGLTEEALHDHGLTFLSDLAQCLSLVAHDGPESGAMLSDGTEIQRLIAERHGSQRARLGWSVDEVHREYAILLEEVLAAVERRVTRASAPDIGRARELLALFVRRAERTAIEAFAADRAASAARPSGE